MRRVSRAWRWAWWTKQSQAFGGGVGGLAVGQAGSKGALSSSRPGEEPDGCSAPLFPPHGAVALCATQKLQAARKNAAARTIRTGDVVFSTAKETGQQVRGRGHAMRCEICCAWCRQ